jgi:histidyl-tRNA synthetase
MFQPPRGTRDFLPKEMYKRNWVFDRVRAVFESYGYEPLGTPAFESWDMLKVKSGDDTINQIYYFRDKSDRELGLRFEWTASLVRVISTHRELPKPFKRYAIGPVWRYERPSEKRFREFYQADADIVGVKDPIADTEVLAVAVDCFKSMGFTGFIIRLNDRRLLEALVEYSGINIDDPLKVFRAIDKLDKIGEDGVRKELYKFNINNDAITKLLGFTSQVGDPTTILAETKKALEGNTKGVVACETLESIMEYSKDFGIDPYIIVDLGLARGLDYYTGPVFEVFAEGFEDFGSIAGGGRYDKVVELYGGEPTPMTGIALGPERIIPLLEKKGAFKDLDLGIDVFVISVSEGALSKAIEITQMLRRSGISTEFDQLQRNMSKQLEVANRKGVRKAVIIGDREIKEGTVTLRDMGTRRQRKIKQEDLLSEFA